MVVGQSKTSSKSRLWDGKGTEREERHDRPLETGYPENRLTFCPNTEGKVILQETS